MEYRLEALIPGSELEYTSGSITQVWGAEVATRSSSVVVSSLTDLNSPQAKPRPSIEGTVSTPYKMGLIAARKIEEEEEEDTI